MPAPKIDAKNVEKVERGYEVLATSITEDCRFWILCGN